MSSFYLDCFLNMPRKVQEMFFDDIERASRITGELEIIDTFCESPIEKIFYFAFLLRSNIPLEPQYEVTANGKSYRADFCFISDNWPWFKTKNPVAVIIECDGHEYHTSKQQVIRDNERDYDLKLAGAEVIHFSGSQIFRDPHKCAKDAEELILKKLKENE